MSKEIKLANSLDGVDIEAFLNLLEERFVTNMGRHKDMDWSEIRSKLHASQEKLLILYRMEQSGGEPDVIGFENGEYIFCDCSKESPEGRRSTCYDKEALDSRKANKPWNSAEQLEQEIGIEMLDEEDYRNLQKLGDFDLKTSSWIKTPEKIRNLGGALFCDKRYGDVFTYHNGAESYYGSR
jgi:hypothetical protein